MKNLFLLPTDKPSRLYEGNLGKPVTIQSASAQLKKPLNIYITSDEEIKKGDWSFDIRGFIEKVDESYDLEVINALGKKIILTTDQYLIKDGVQVIEDEFLEWFVKNPSCERVEVRHLLKSIFDPKTNEKHPVVQYRHFDLAKMICEYKYEIIIPKEEPKQECFVTKCMQLDAEIAYKSLPKQETLEEAKIEYHFENDIEMFEFMNEMASTGKIPKKWSLFVSKINDLYRQQERMYSEEELLQILESHKDNLEFDKDRFEHDRWFEQFKKK